MIRLDGENLAGLEEGAERWEKPGLPLQAFVTHFLKLCSLLEGTDGL